MDILLQYGRRSLGPRWLRRVLSASVGLFLLKGLAWLGLALWWLPKHL